MMLLEFFRILIVRIGERIREFSEVDFSVFFFFLHFICEGLRKVFCGLNVLFGEVAVQFRF